MRRLARRLFTLCSAVSLAAVAGCSLGHVQPSDERNSRLTPVSGIAQPVYPEEVSRLSTDERQAVVAATAALRQAGFPLLDDIAFEIARTETGWWVFVWVWKRYELGGPRVPQLGPSAVALDDNWNLTAIHPGK